MRVVGRAQHSLALLCQLHQFVRRLARGRVEVGGVLVGNDQEMPANVRIKIKEDEVEAGAVDNEILFILRFVLRQRAEDTAGIIDSLLTARSGDVLVTPRSPQSVHVLATCELTNFMAARMGRSRSDFPL